MLSAEQDFRFYSGLTNQGLGADAAKVARWNIRAPQLLIKALTGVFFWTTVAASKGCWARKSPFRFPECAMAQLSVTSWSPELPADKAIAEQLQRLLTHPLFKNSKRCSSLLRHIVEHCLSHDTAPLKERMIGIQVFKRSADYDTSSDPVVRSAACELRKRMAQYYHEDGHSRELRIELPVGSYTALFEPPAPDASAQTPSPDHSSGTCSGGNVSRWRFAYAVATCLAAASIAVAVWSADRKPLSLDRFWGQVTSAQGPVLLCIGTRNVQTFEAGLAGKVEYSSSDFRDVLPVTDAVAFSDIAAFLGERQKAYRVQTAKATTMSDLVQGPSVVVGAFDNPWAIRITDPLRFHFEQKGEDLHYISDRKNANRQYVEIESETPGRDFAIVARIFNDATGQITVVAAGLGAAGTTAASELLTSPVYIDNLLRQTPGKLAAKNVEAVISVPVIDNIPGTPHVEAFEVW